MGPALNLLLDTSTLLWITSEPRRVSAAARAGLDDTANRLWISAASAWEVATKHRAGRLPQGAPLVADWRGHLDRYRFSEVAITSRHALRAGSYAVAHADPFDRMIAAQAELDELVLVGSDRAFDLFPVARLW